MAYPLSYFFVIRLRITVQNRCIKIIRLHINLIILMNLLRTDHRICSTYNPINVTFLGHTKSDDINRMIMKQVPTINGFY